ncbi:MAG: 4Fe-4S binding protein, partial [Spirochaetes bacterium]|nr:4Fe-4S binding protein [Spirochaetota bacterium]
MLNHKLLFFILILISLPIFAQDRFPKPDFESNYQIPRTIHPEVDPILLDLLDISVLILAFSVALYLLFKKRNRTGIIILMFLSLFYFGFYRKGCICSIGAIQNVTQAIFQQNYILPLSVLVIFLLPLIVALFRGRVYCSSICPLGVIQDLVLLKSHQIPVPVKTILKLVPPFIL